MESIVIVIAIAIGTIESAWAMARLTNKNRLISAIVALFIGVTMTIVAGAATVE